MLNELKRFEDALTNYDKAIALKPDNAQAHIGRAAILRRLQRYDEAIASYDKAIFLTPDNAEAHEGRGDALIQSQSYIEEPVLNGEITLLAAKPVKAFALNNFIAVLKLKSALVSYDTAIALKPDYVEAYINRGHVLYELNRLEEALASYDKAITLKADLAFIHVNRGNILTNLNRHEEATTSYEKAIALKPDFEFLLGRLLYRKMYFCDWSNFEVMIAQLADKINHAKKVSSPYSIFAASNSPDLARKAAEIYTQTKYPLNNALPTIPKRQTRGRIRIGYFSADFREHPTSNLAVELFERHDRSQFEVMGFSFGPFTNDEMQKRVVLAFDEFNDLRYQSDKAVAMLARKLEIDIAVDLNGLMSGHRTNIFSMRAAPVQVNYLAFPGTMGSTYVDYLIADSTLIPQSEQKYYAEKIVYLPNSYQVNSKRRILDRAYTRAEVGLPEVGFVFCCFNNNYKITAKVFDCWMRILNRVQSSVLWILEDNTRATTNLRKEAGARGINPDRVVFAKRISLPDHLARQRLADLFLDTLPYNAHATASDALWAGLPILTQIGQTFAGRMAASLLNAIGLPELITSTPQGYESLAIEIASNPEKLASIKLKLANNRLTTPLFDIHLFTKHVEAAYTAMYNRYQEDLPPDHIYVLH